MGDVEVSVRLNNGGEGESKDHDLGPCEEGGHGAG